MSDWTTSKLSDVIEIIGGGTPKRSENKYWNGDIPWLSVTDFNNDFRYVNDSIEYITELGLQKSSTKLLDKDHLIISARGTVGCLAQLSVPMAFNQSCYGLNGKEGILDNGFLYYFLKNNISELKQKTHGAVFDTITRDTFEHIQISYPDLDTQKEIAKNLGSFDDKIQLNTQINQTLEQIAQALFKSWFVDFDPVRAKVQALSDGLSLEQAELAAMQAISGKTPEELTALSQTQPDRYAELAETAKAFPCEIVEVDGVEVPKGWTFQYLKDVCNIVYGKGLPKTKLTNTGYRVFGANGVIGYYSEFMYKNPQILIGCRGTVGQVTVSTPFSFITNNSLIIEYENSLINRYYLEHYLRTLNLKEISSGSVQPQITIQNMSGVKLLTPNRETLSLYEINVKDIYETMYQNQIENEKLTKARDLLLPKLLNGEI